ncbi:hypothetical protein EJ03DRAFT_345873 [Teratosphaeria nubilosa]|uniref:Major facilitator superfamily (MFS) profile domain-containing protein n=1 Tax=Teratosphaeria nubilosa TaxID=161662 RepID=A0A6G1KWX4_9PEZI|nr:hypothetical protein EJ03DRAFT_345873 [Teratosphaeria nubilosa]
MLSLTRSASAISGHRAGFYRQHNNDAETGVEVSKFDVPGGPGAVSYVSRPPPMKLGNTAQDQYPDVGTIASWRGSLILVITCGAQLLDNVFMTGVNISLPAIQKTFDIDGINLQWLISAYTLTFGGFLLLAGLAIFRALQGMGAAMTVPSGVGIISAFFVSRDRTKALTYFGAAGAVGFCVGLLLGGFLTSSLGWRYLFYISVIMTGSTGALGWFVLPRDRQEEGRVKPKLDLLGAGLSTAGLVLLSFVISSGAEYGWGTAMIIVLLVVSIAMLAIFTFIEKKVPNPIMPLSLWKLENFAILWVAGFVAYGGYQTLLYYVILVAQEVMDLSAGATALRFIPMAFVGAAVSMALGRLMERINTNLLLLIGLGFFCTVAPIPTALISGENPSFWKHIFPTSILSVTGIGTTYCTITVVALASVPVSAKSLCGGMINTAFQIGSEVGLALASAVVDATQTNQGHSALAQYRTGLWCCAGLAGIGIVPSGTSFGLI